MTNTNLAELTDKEKQALRLLLSGHDAKSSAIELDISVHALNDRLRNARRKLGVSSSREAARILGDAEGGSPQNPVRNSFGMAESASVGDTAVLNQTRRSGPSRAVWLTGGMLIMSLTIAAIAVVSIYGAADSGEATTAAASENEFIEKAATDPESEARANAFLAEVDALDWQGSWDVSGSFFRSQVTADEWAEQVKPVREPLGAVRSRSLTNVQRTSSLPGAPEGEYEVLQYQTEFSGISRNATETLVMMMGPDGWEVSGYFIR